MAALGSQSIASSYEQLLHVDRDGGGNTTNLVDIKDGDNETTFALQLATDKINVNGSATITGALTANSGSKITSSSADTTFSVETTSGSTIFPVIDLVSSHSSVGGKIRQGGSDVISLDKSQNATFGANVVIPAPAEDAVSLEVGGAIESSAGLSTFGSAVTIINKRNSADQHGLVVGAKNSSSFPLIVGRHDATFNDLVVSGSGNVGIGTDSPAVSMHINKTAPTGIAKADSFLHLGVAVGNAERATIGFGYSGGTNIPAAISYKNTNNGGSTTGELGFFTRSGTSDAAPTQAMTIDSSQKVGIGTTSPTAPITAEFTSSTTNATSNSSLTHNSGLYLQNLSTANESYAGVGFRSHNFDGGLALVYEGSDNVGRFSFNLEGSEKLVIKSTGNVGIGTTSPDNTVHIHKGSAGTVDGNANAPLVVENSGDTNIHLLSPNTADQFILFGSNSGIRTYIQADLNATASSESLGFYTNLTQVLKLDANSRISLSNNDLGTQNTIFGKNAGNNAVSGSIQNVFIGESTAGSGTRHADADGNTAVGYNSLTNLTQGAYNTMYGRETGVAITEGDSNVAIGSGAIATATTASSMVAIGGGALYSASAGQTTTNGTVAIGVNSLGVLTSGAGNVAVGFESLMTEDAGSYSTAIGHQALKVQNVDNANNVAIGYNAAVSMTTGKENVIIGSAAGDASQDIDQAVVIGSSAMGNGNATDGADGTVAIGKLALFSLTSGSGNVAIGSSSMDSVETGSHNTALGYLALSNMSANSSHNTAVGRSALLNMSVNDDGKNTALGSEAGDVITSGTKNTCIGAGTDPNTNGGVNQTVIGYGTVGQGDNTVTLGDANVTHVCLGHEGATAVAKAAGFVFPNSQVANANANTLDDYEEGEYNPALTCASSGTFGFDGNADTLVYTKIGRQVHVQGEVHVTSEASSPSGDLRLTLPFTANVTDLTDSADVAIGTLQLNSSGSSLVGQLYCRTQGGLNYLTFRMRNDDCSETVLQHDDVDTDFYIGINITYNA